jgi:hypothetical protein
MFHSGNSRGRSHEGGRKLNRFLSLSIQGIPEAEPLKGAKSSTDSCRFPTKPRKQSFGYVSGSGEKQQICDREERVIKLFRNVEVLMLLKSEVASIVFPLLCSVNDSGQEPIYFIHNTVYAIPFMALSAEAVFVKNSILRYIYKKSQRVG